MKLWKYIGVEDEMGNAKISCFFCFFYQEERFKYGIEGGRTNCDWHLFQTNLLFFCKDQ